jgi:hypothetical protein
MKYIPKKKAFRFTGSPMAIQHGRSYFCNYSSKHQLKSQYEEA